jgi:LysM repeat protein
MVDYVMLTNLIAQLWPTGRWMCQQDKEDTVRSTPFTLRWFVIPIILLLALSACERPVPRDETSETPDTTAPTTSPIEIPTALPTEAPTSEAGVTPDTGAPSDTGAGTPTPTEEPGAEPTVDSAGDTTGDTTGDSPPPDVTEGEETTYTVQTGDTLGQIAENFDVTVEEIAAANGLANIDSLDVGQILTIPVAGTVEIEPPEGEERTHVVKSGENLFRIGLAYGFTAEELAAFNGILDPARIELGQIIRIPPDG